jgi:hypothetical protein
MGRLLGLRARIGTQVGGRWTIGENEVPNPGRGSGSFSEASWRSKSLCWFHLRTLGHDERKAAGTQALAGVCLG